MDDNDDEIAFFFIWPNSCYSILRGNMISSNEMFGDDWMRIYIKVKRNLLCDDDSWYMIGLHASWVLMNISKALQWAGNWLTAHK